MTAAFGTWQRGVECVDFHYTGRCKFHCTHCGSKWEEVVPTEIVDGITAVRADLHSRCAECQKLDLLADKIVERLRS